MTVMTNVVKRRRSDLPVFGGLVFGDSVDEGGLCVSVPDHPVDDGLVGGQQGLCHLGHVDAEGLLDQHVVVVRHGEAVHVARVEAPPGGHPTHLRVATESLRRPHVQVHLDLGRLRVSAEDNDGSPVIMVSLVCNS